LHDSRGRAMHEIIRVCIPLLLAQVQHPSILARVAFLGSNSTLVTHYIVLILGKKQKKKQKEEWSIDPRPYPTI